MLFEIAFIDVAGRACLHFRAGFADVEHATRYARNVMRETTKPIAAAEIGGGTIPDVLLIANGALAVASLERPAA